MKRIVDLIIEKKQIVITMSLLVSMIHIGQAQDTLFIDTCGSETGWTLDSSSAASYIKWRVNNECAINGGALAVNAFDTTDTSWKCEYWWDQDLPVGIVAYKTVNASSAHSLTLTFDWKSIGEWFQTTVYDYGQVGYSTDGGNTFIWFDLGGTTVGKYYDQTSVKTGETLILPASLNNSTFEIGFRWINDGSVGADPAFIVDNIQVTGYTTTLVQTTYDFESNDGAFTHEALTGTDEWEWGTPSTVGPSSTHSGAKCWGTDLDNTYQENSAIVLYSPELIVQNTYAIINYWNWHDIEFGYDEGQPDYRINGGAWTDMAPSLIDGVSSGWEERTYRIDGLTVGDKLEVRWLLDTDGTLQEPGWYIDDVSITNAITIDNTSQVKTGPGHVLATIPSTITAEEARVIVFDVTLQDAGSGDASPTIIDQMIFRQGSVNAVADWTNAIAGARLSGPDLGTEAIGTISATNISFSGSGIISIADNTSEIYELKIWLKTDLSALNDNDRLEFKLDYQDITTDPAGSAFGSGVEESGDLKNAIDISSTGLVFVTGIPPSSVLTNQDFSVEVHAADGNGNIDTDINSGAFLSRYTGTGTLSSVTGLNKNLVNGVYTWTDVRYDVAENFVIRATPEAPISSGFTGTITAIGAIIFDFENSPENFLESSTGDDLWEWGTPNVTGLTSGHKESAKCAGIDLDGIYEANTTYILYTPELIALGATVDFDSWNWYITEAGDDICSIQYQVNGGTWTTISSGDFSGTSGDWIFKDGTITGLTLGDVIQIRWMLVTDQNQHKEGWYVDDVRVTNVAFPLDISAVITPANCSNQNLGQIDLTISGGKLPYTFAWSNGLTTEDVNDIVGGIYTVTVTDDNGIIKSQEITVNNTPYWDYLAGIDPAGTGQLVKEAGLSSSQTNSWANSWNELIGDGSVSFIIANTTDEFIIGLSATEHTEGSYYAIEYALERDLDEVYISIGGSFPELTSYAVGDVFTIKREGTTVSFLKNDVAFTHTETIASATPLYIEASIETQDGIIDNIEANFCGVLTIIDATITNASCATCSDGAIDLTIIGGGPPYQFNWSTGEATEDLSSLSFGIYIPIITDTLNDTLTAEYTVLAPGITCWTGAIDGNFFNDSNWTDSVPGINDPVIVGDFNATGVQQISLSSGPLAEMGPLEIGTGSAVVTLIAGAFDLKFNGDLRIGANGTITNTTNTVSLQGNWVNNGAFDEGTGTVIFNGASNQNLSNVAGLEKFYNLEMTKTGGDLILSVAVEVNNNLLMTNGNIVTTSTELLTINNDATSSGASEASFVDGPLEKIGDDAFVFPIGEAQGGVGTGGYHALSITAPLNATESFTAQYIKTAQLFGSVKACLQQISPCEHWTLANSGGNSPVVIKLGWNANSCNIATPISGNTVISWNGNSWITLGTGSTTGTVSVGTVTSATTATVYGPFAIGLVSVSQFSLSLDSKNVSCTGVCDGEATVTVNGGTAPFTYQWTENGVGPWVQKTDFGGTARFGAVGFSINNRGYIGTGDEALPKSDFWEFNPSTGTWSQKADFGGGNRWAAVGFSIGNRGYIGTGFNAGSNYNDLWEYNPNTNTWTQKANFGGTARNSAVGFSINDKGYIGTGYDGSNLRDFWEYNPINDVWTSKADLTGVARNEAVGFSLLGQGYIGTGIVTGVGTLLKDFWKYDPASDLWTQKSDFAGTARSGAVGFSIDQTAYLGTGKSASYEDDFWGYDPIGNTWTLHASFRGTPRNAAVGFSLGCRGYIGTGFDGADQGDFWSFFPLQTSDTSVCLCPGDYKVVVIDNNGCVGSINTTIKDSRVGQAVTTYFGSSASDFVLSILDVREPAVNGAIPTEHWATSFYQAPAWTRQNLGNIFGVVTDNDRNQNIYVTATSSYPTDIFGPAGSGGIYKIDGLSDAITQFAQLPNSGPALGNICFDPVREQFFVTNLEDGNIYRLSKNGQIEERFDPFAGQYWSSNSADPNYYPMDNSGAAGDQIKDYVPNNTTPGFVALGERLWGLQYYQNRLYFGVWNNHKDPINDGVKNQIYSIGIGSTGFVGSVILEIDIPFYPFSNTVHSNVGSIGFSNPIADIEFSKVGKMMLAERDMLGDNTPSKNDARLMEYENCSGTWLLTSSQFFVGSTGTNENSSGGIAYTPEGDVWAMGDEIKNQGSPAQLYDGLAFVDVLGNTPTTASNSFLIDLDYDPTVTNAIEIGDVELFNCDPICTFNLCVSSTATCCDGLCDGVITVAAIDGIPPYTYLWDDPNKQTNATIFGLCAGTYHVLVTDSNGCSASICQVLTPDCSSQTDQSICGVKFLDANCNGIKDASESGLVGWVIELKDASGSQLIATTTTDVNGNYCFAVGFPGDYTVAEVDKTDWVQSIPANQEDHQIALPANQSIQGIDFGNCSVPAGCACTIDPQLSFTTAGCTVSFTGSATQNSCVQIVEWLWDFGDDKTSIQQNPDHIFHGPGPFTVCLTTTANGGQCQNSTCETVNPSSCVDPCIDAAPQITSNTITDVSCNAVCGAPCDGEVELVVSGGTSPLTFSWNTTPEQTTNVATGLCAGTYFVTISDLNNCSTEESFIVKEGAILSAEVIATNATCTGLNDGSVVLTATGGAPFYLFSLNGGTFQSNGAFTGLSVGTHTVSIQDSNNCVVDVPFCIKEPTISVTASNTDVTCTGTCDGVLTASDATGGTPPYVYTWTVGGAGVGVGQVLTGICPGSYQVSVADANGCTVISPTTIIVSPNALTASVSSTLDISCPGNSDGAAIVNITNGTTPYNFSWSTGGSGVTSASAAETNMPVGVHTITITDDNGCVFILAVTIFEPVAIISASTNISCNGVNDGTATVSISGSALTLPYDYTWSTGGVTPGSYLTINAETGMPPGVHTVTITDFVGCILVANVTITEPALFTASASLNNDVSCNGGSDGSATVTVTGGTPPFVYDWSTSAPKAATSSTSDIETGMNAGAQNVTITDANGCTASDNITINQPVFPIIGIITSFDNVTCFNAVDGTATVTIAGGTPPYNVEWSTGGNRSTAGIDQETLIPAGNHTVTITDANGCPPVVVAFTITQPNLLFGDNLVTTDISCFGLTDGAASVNVNGGTAPFIFDWSAGGQTSVNNASGLPKGLQNVIITDANGCISSAVSFTIVEPDELLGSITASSSVSCNGGSDGTATVTITGGTSQFNYSWSTGGATGPTASLINQETGMPSGTHTVTITDANSCIKTVNVTISEPTTPLVVNLTTTDETCPPNNDGSATITITGGDVPYNYNWLTSGNNGTTSPSTENNIPAGTHTVTVSDNNGCVVNTNFTITELVATFSNVINATCTGISDGSATINVINGTSPYAYLWSTGGTGTTEGNLPAGTVTVTITDNSGCIISASVTISEPLLVATITSSGNISCSGGNDGTATVSISGGTAPFVYDWSTSAPKAATSSTSDIETGMNAGAHNVTITDANGCTANTTITINEPSGPLAGFIVSQGNIGCNGATNGSITVDATGGTPSFTFDIGSGAQSSGLFTSLSAGNYTITVEDVNGCTDNIFVVITEPAALSLSISSIDPCNGLCNGEATVAISGGPPPYGLLWDDPLNQTSTTAIGLCAGVYNISVMDLNRCITSGTVTLTNQVLVLNIADEVVCPNQSVQLNLTPLTGGTYGWTPVDGLNCPTCESPFSTISELTVYTVGFQSENCLVTTDVTVDVDPLFSLSWTSSTSDNITYSFTALPNGMTTYFWNFGDGGISTIQNPTHTYLNPGTYTVCLTATNSCGTNPICIMVTVDIDCF